MLILLEKTLAISLDILDKCKNQRWDEVDALQQERTLLMSQISNTELPIDIASCEKLSSQLKTVNDKIIYLSNINKEDIYKAIKKANKSKKMHNAYNL